jgi:diguanylate cyclase (GGDEF)-like protein
MTEIGEATTTAEPTRAPRRFAWPVMLVLLSAAGWWGIWLLCFSGASQTRWPEQVVLPAAILLFVCLTMLRHEWHWQRPMRRLLALLPQIRAGESPIDDLSSIRGGSIEPLIPMLQEMLHELRRQRRELAALSQEMQQRVANRTDALERALGSMQQQASRDPLSGLYNRRLFDQSLRRLFDTCRADAQNMALMMIDVDHFKALNDTLGHAAGDQLLRDIGQLIRSSIREGTDAAFRIGGDEFVIIMPCADSEAADAVSRRLISLVDAHAKTLRSIPSPRLSVGIATLLKLPPDNATPLELLRSADRRLYEVKSQRKSARA